MVNAISITDSLNSGGYETVSSTAYTVPAGKFSTVNVSMAIIGGANTSFGELTVSGVRIFYDVPGEGSNTNVMLTGIVLTAGHSVTITGYNGAQVSIHVGGFEEDI